MNENNKVKWRSAEGLFRSKKDPKMLTGRFNSYSEGLLREILSVITSGGEVPIIVSPMREDWIKPNGPTYNITVGLPEDIAITPPVKAKGMDDDIPF